MCASSSHQDKSHNDNLPPPLPPHLHLMPPVENHHVRQLLFVAAELISRSDLSAASRLLSTLSSHSSAYGDSSDRIIHYFTKALALRLKNIHKSNQYDNLILQSAARPATSQFRNFNTRQTHYLTHNNSTNPSNQYEDVNILNINSLYSSYLTLNQITPFIRFIHFTSNQAILEAMHQTNHQPQHIHIIDFDIMHGVQWPPLMQAIADHYPPPSLRITALGTNLSILHRTGDRLSKFAHSLGLNFQFHTTLLANTSVDHLVDHLSAVLIRPNETLAINCVMYLHRQLTNRDNLCLLLNKIKSMNPNVVTLSEQEANHNQIFLPRFTEALHYYTAVFESLEATLPPTSRDRMEVEQVWFGREIADIVAEEGDCRKLRHERYRSWEVMMVSAGFVKVPLSGYALTQAKLLLRLHYPCDGYDVQVVDDCFFLGWRNRPLYSVSSWR